MKLKPHSQRNKIILLFVTGVVGIGLVSFVFSASGPFRHFWNLDLDFLLTPIISFLLLSVIASILPLVLHTHYISIFSAIISYLAIVILSYWVLQRFTLLTRIPIFSQKIEILNSLRISAVYLAWLWAGLGFWRVSGLIDSKFRSGQLNVRPFISMLGFLIMGISIWKALDILSLNWAPLKEFGFTLGFSFVVFGLTRLSANFTSQLSLKVAYPLKWSLHHPGKFFFLTLFILIYFIFVRPFIYSISSFSYLIEWILICFAGYKILILLKNHISTYHSQLVFDREWSKHQQLTAEISDDDFNKMISLQMEFIESGLRRNLLLFLRRLMFINGIPEEQISLSLQPVIEYNDARKRWYHYWFFKNRFLQGNVKRRCQVLEDSMGRIKTLVFHTYKYMNGVRHE